MSPILFLFRAGKAAGADAPAASNCIQTEEQLLQIPDYIDTYDDLIDVIRRKDGWIRLMLGKKINGHSIVIEAVSSGRKSLHPVTAYQIDSDKYERDYKKKAVDRSSTSLRNKSGTVDISRPATASAATLTHSGDDVKARMGEAGRRT